MIRSALALLLFGCLAATQVAAGTLSLVSQERWVTVNHIIDGDTFATRDGEKIRLLGINTPETQHESSPAQPFGDEAKAALQRLISGQQVRLRFDQEKKDQYQRTLAHVYLKNGLWVNGELVRLGLAHVYTFTPNTSAAPALLKIEQQAIADERSMWQHKRWKVLTPEQLKQDMLGTFRLVTGEVLQSDHKPWQFKLGKLTVTVPLKYRQGFKAWHAPGQGEKVLVRGKLRVSSTGHWFLSIHTPTDMTLVQ